MRAKYRAPEACDRLSRPFARGAGFTLLELIMAFAILALFVLPILEIVAAARVRAVKYTRDRMVQDLAQRKLFESIHYLEAADSGTFEAEGRPDWTWEVLPPEIVSRGAETLLQYTIRVTTPQSEAASEAAHGEARPAYEMSVWTFPSPEWLEEEQYRQAMGYDTGMDWGLPGGVLGR